MRINLYSVVIAAIACSALQSMETGKVITPTSGVVTSENGWIIDIHSDHTFIPTGSTKIYSTMPVKRRGLTFTPKNLEEGKKKPTSNNNSNSSKTEIHGEPEEPEESGHQNALTHDVMRDSHNSLMSGLQANLSNMASIANMSTTQWKRTMTVVVVSGIFGVTQLALQAYLASHNCAK